MGGLWSIYTLSYLFIYLPIFTLTCRLDLLIIMHCIYKYAFTTQTDITR